MTWPLRVKISNGKRDRSRRQCERQGPAQFTSAVAWRLTCRSPPKSAYAIPRTDPSAITRIDFVVQGSNLPLDLAKPKSFTGESPFSEFPEFMKVEEAHWQKR